MTSRIEYLILTCRIQVFIFVYVFDEKSNINVLFRRQVKNPVVPACIVCIFVIYSMLLVLVMKFDQHDDLKSDIVRLADNSPFDRQKYYVSLETGFRKGAGTTAQVGCSGCGNNHDNGQ